jgi:hypothetical protein
MIIIVKASGNNPETNLKDFYLITWEYLYKCLVYLTIEAPGDCPECKYVDSFISTLLSLPEVV